MHVIYDIAKTGSIRTVHSIRVENRLALVDELETSLLTRTLIAPDGITYLRCVYGYDIALCNYAVASALLLQAASDSSVILPMAQAILCTMQGSTGHFQFLDLPEHTDLSYQAMREYLATVVGRWITWLSELDCPIVVPQAFKTEKFKLSVQNYCIKHLAEIFV